ncbi:hypothetical protein PF003_g9163 [Phytophthora fragariae]|nr:hypothetical protein PF003_g9163 [Phytophthora fragariae]
MSPRRWGFTDYPREALNDNGLAEYVDCGVKWPRWIGYWFSWFKYDWCFYGGICGHYYGGF